MTITVATTTSGFATSESTQLDLAQLTLALDVPLVMDDLSKQIDPDTGKRGPNAYQRDAAHEYITHQRLSEDIMFCTKHKTAESMTVLIQIVAILAFCPGGVNVVGMHFESRGESEVSHD